MKRFILVTICSFVMGLTASHAQSAVPCVNKYVNNQHVTQNQFDAMVDFTFNVGCGNFRKSTLLKDVNAGKMTAASNEFGKWIYDSQHHKLAGLIRRRAQEKALFLKP